MTNDEVPRRVNKVVVEAVSSFEFRHSFVIGSFVIRHCAAVLGLMAFAFSGCGKPANDSATSAKVTVHVNEMRERLHLF